MKRHFIFAGLAVALAACAPPAPKAVETETAAPTIAPPPAELAVNFPDCTWGAVNGGGVTLNAFSCETVKFEGDETLPGIVRVATLPDGGVARSPVIQVFSKAPDAPLEAVLEAVRKASPGSETCTFIEAPEGYRREGQLVSVLWPTGKAKTNYDAYIAGKNNNPASLLPCGQFGPSEAGAVTFEVRQEAPGKVLAIFWPSDIAPWDFNNVKVTP